MATVKKYNVPRDNAMADALDRQDGYGKYAPKKNDAINNKPLKEGKLNSDSKPKAMKSGGKVKNWIQGAVNPKHKGYCTPMTKATCTPKRKALAKTFKAMGRARKGK
jgi:hypothetical protein